MFGVVSLTMGNSRFPAGDRLARDVEFVCELFLRHAGAFAASGDFGSYGHTEDLLLLGLFYTKTVGKATMSTWNFRNFELRRAIFGGILQTLLGRGVILLRIPRTYRGRSGRRFHRNRDRCSRILRRNF